MSILCSIFGHSFGGFYLKDIDGTYFEPQIFDAAGGKLVVYRYCPRCKQYEERQWGIK